MEQKNRAQLNAELKELIMEQAKLCDALRRGGNEEYLEKRIAESRILVEAKRIEIQRWRETIIKRIEFFQDTAEFKVLLCRYVYQMDWDSIAQSIYGPTGKAEYARLVLESIAWDRPELIEWLDTYASMDGLGC